MTRKRLTDKHPTSIKLNKVFDLMDALGLSVEINNIRTLVQDKEHGVFELADIEHTNSHCNMATEFPMVMEWCLIKDC